AAAESVALGVALSKLLIETRELPGDGPLVCAETEIASENAVDIVQTSRHFNPNFDNASFWTERYLGNPGLGSGLGSRAASRALKTALIRHTLEREHSGSVLDIGCGDLASVAEITAYHEPIMRTLARCGVKSMRIIASYRDTVVVEFAHAQSFCM